MYDETVTVVENRPLTGGHFLLSVHSPRQAQATRPGQFAMVRLLGRSDVLLRRPMSIYDVKPDGSAGVPPASLRARPERSEGAGPPAAARGPLHSTIRPQHPKTGGHRPPPQKAQNIPLLHKGVGRGTRLMAGLTPR